MATASQKKKVEKVMHEHKHGTLKSGSGKKVKSRKQAIAIGLSEAREKGGKVPSRKAARKSGLERVKIPLVSTCSLPFPFLCPCA